MPPLLAPRSNPSVGGMASTRGSGLSTLMYGTTAENVVSLQVVTPDGKLIQTRRRVRKSATGRGRGGQTSTHVYAIREAGLA